MKIAFENTQLVMKEQLPLGHLNYGQTIVVSADASVLGVGGCLGNRYVDSDGEVVNRVVACASHAFICYRCDLSFSGVFFLYVIYCIFLDVF